MKTIINPGKLKHSIYILKVTTEVDDEGYKSSKTEKRKVRALLEKFKSTDHDYRVDDITSTKSLLTCVIRKTDIQNTDRVEINDVIYEVFDIEDIDFEQRFLRIAVKSV